MKKTILTVTMVAGLAVCSYGQGTLGSAGSFSSPLANEYGSFGLDNANNTAPSTSASTGGLVWIGNTFNTASLLNQDVNIAVYDGSSLVVSLTGIASGPANGDGTFLGNGNFADNSSVTYYDTLSVGGATRTLTLDFWTGNDATYAAAAADVGVYVGTATFAQALGNGGSPAGASTEFQSMPAIVMLPVTSVPEPTTLALAGLGGAALLAFRRRKA